MITDDNASRQSLPSPSASARELLSHESPASLYTRNGIPPRDEGPDPFDPASLRLSPDMTDSLGVKRALVTIPVRRPAKEWFFRVHASPDYQLTTAILELKEEREVYLVAPHLWSAMAGESCFSPRVLFACMSRQNVFFFWPIRLPTAGGRLDAWSKSALEAAEIAMRTWVRVQSDMSLGAYTVTYSDAVTDEPAWPELSMSALLRIAFKDRYIDRHDHVVLQQLRGEVYHAPAPAALPRSLDHRF